MIHRLVRRVKGALWWNRALTLAAKGEYEATIRYLRAIDDLGTFSLAKGDSNYPAYSGILRGYSLARLERYQQAAEVLASAQEHLMSRGVEDDETRYLRCYIAILGQKSLAGLIATANLASKLEMRTDYRDLFTVDFASVDLRRVPAHVKQKFPLRPHPDWKE